MKTAYKSIVSIVLVSLLVSLLPIRLAQGQPETSYIIVHAHNPEGVEIASIQGVGQGSVPIYEGNTLIGYGAYNAETHYRRIPISPGNHTIGAKFNGMTLEQNITLAEGETKVLTFTFTRTEFDIYSGNPSPPQWGVDNPLHWEYFTTIQNIAYARTPITDLFTCWYLQALFPTSYVQYGNGYYAELPNWSYFHSLYSPYCILFNAINNRVGGIEFRESEFPINKSPVKCSSVPYDLLGTGVRDGETPQPPVASFSYSPAKPMVGGNIIFDASASYDPDGTIVDYQWDFGDGNTTSGEVVTHTYSEAGEYTITLTVTDDDGLTDSILSEVNVVAHQPPVASFYWWPYNPSAGDEITFDGSYSYDPDGGEITAYTWDFGDGNTAEGEVVTHTYAQPGEYTVELTVTNDKGVIASTSDSVNVTSLEVEIVDPYPDLINNGNVTSDIEQLGSDAGHWVYGFVADGVTPLLIKAQVFSSGIVNFSLKDETGSSTDAGTLSTPGGNEGVTTLQVTVSKLSDGRYMAFAVLTAPPAFFRGPGDESLYGRPINIEANFTPSGDGYEATDNYETWLIRPPVVMVHGLWGNGGDFADLNTELYNNGFMYLYRPSYNNSASFATNDWVLPNLINNILTNLRTEGGFACAKVDIVAHSMGGLLAKRLDPSFAQKNVRKIITIGTPYSGSPLADELWEALLYDPIRTYSLENLINLFISHNAKSVTGGAIKDLRCYNNPNIPVSTKVQGVDCRNVIVGLRDGALWDPELNVYVTGLMIMTRKWTPEAAHDFIFGPAANSDWVVSENSQQYDADIYQVIPVHWHCSETQDADFKSIVLATLNQPAQIIGNISSGLVIGEPYTISSHKVSHIEKGIYSLSSEPNGTVEIVAPLAGGTCTAGQSITISVVGTGDTTHAGVFAFFGSSSWGDIVQLPWTGDVNVPSNSVGSSVKIYAIGLDNDMNITDQDEVDLVLDTNVVLSDIFFGFGYEWTFDFKTFPLQSHEFQLYPMGVFSDGSEHPLSVLSEPTTYETYDANIATVDANGLITVHSRGTTWIMVTCSERTSYLQIEVDALIGDLNLNGMVDFSDFAILAGQWLQPPVIPSADIAPESRDGVVDLLDLAVFVEHWLEGTGFWPAMDISGIWQLYMTPDSWIETGPDCVYIHQWEGYLWLPLSHQPEYDMWASGQISGDKIDFSCDSSSFDPPLHFTASATVSSDGISIAGTYSFTGSYNETGTWRAIRAECKKAEGWVRVANVEGSYYLDIFAWDDTIPDGIWFGSVEVTGPHIGTISLYCTAPAPDDEYYEYYSWEGNASLGQVAPAPGEVYNFTVHYSDGTLETVSTSIRETRVGFPTSLLPINGQVIQTDTPTFSWQPPSCGCQGYYRVWIVDENGQDVWSVYLPKETTEVNYNFDGTAVPLQFGKTYEWRLITFDNAPGGPDNYVSLMNTFIVEFTTP